MPVLPGDHPKAQELKHSLFVGRAVVPASSSTLGPQVTNYRFIWLKGDFTLEEASDFVLATLDECGTPHSKGDSFGDPQMSVHTVGLSLVHRTDSPPRFDPQYDLLNYLIDHYSTVEYMSCYWWHVYRHMFCRICDRFILKKAFNYA